MHTFQTINYAFLLDSILLGKGQAPLPVFPAMDVK